MEGEEGEAEIVSEMGWEYEREDAGVEQGGCRFPDARDADLVVQWC